MQQHRMRQRAMQLPAMRQHSADNLNDATAFHDIESYHITTIEAAAEWLTLRMARNQPHPLDYRRLREEVEEDNVMPLDILLCAVAVVTGKWIVMAAFSNGRRGTVVNDLPGFSLLYLPKDHPLKVKSIPSLKTLAAALLDEEPH